MERIRKILIWCSLIPLLASCGPSAPIQTADHIHTSTPPTGIQNTSPGETAATAPADAIPATGQTPDSAQAGSTLPQLIIREQDFSGGQVVIDQVVSQGPGWVVIQAPDPIGNPGEEIGYAPVEDGVTQSLGVSIETGRESPVLYARLNADSGQIGVYEGPQTDAPVMDGGQEVLFVIQNSPGVALVPQITAAPPASASPPAPTATHAVSTETAVPELPPTPAAPTATEVLATPAPVEGSLPSITAFDQPIHQEMVIFSKVYSQGDSWLVIHPQFADGTLASYIGFAPLHDGLNENVRVRMDLDWVRQSLVAMIHVNKSKADRPAFPGPDDPLMVNGQMVISPFKIQGSLHGNMLLTTRTGDENTPYLADSFGMALYQNLTDIPTRNCAGECLGSFRPLRASGDLVAGSGLDQDKIGQSPLADGTQQLTYNGVRLYYYLDDRSPGDTLGHGLDDVWVLAVP